MGRVALRIGIAGLIGAIVAVIGGVRWPGSPTAVTAEAFVVHCTLTALGLLVCAHLRRRRALTSPSQHQGQGALTRIGMVILAIAPIAVISVNGYLAFEAVRAGGEKLWIFAFAVPALLAFLGLGGNANEHLNPGSDGETDVVTQSAEGFWDTVKAYLRQTISIITYLTILIAALLIGTIYAVTVRAALIDDQFYGWEIFVRVIERLDQWQLLELAVPILVLAVLYPIFGVLAGLWVKFRRGRRGDFDRQLSVDEVEAIETYATSVEDFAESTNTSSVRWIVFVWPFGFLLLIPFLFFVGDNGLASSLFEPIRTPQDGWYIYNDGPGGTEVFVFITAFAAYCLLATAAPLFSEKLAVLSFATNAQQSMRGDSPAQLLRRQIAVDIRRGDLKPGEDFDPAAYLRHGARKIFRLTLNITIAFAGIAIVCLIADRADFEMITEDGITYRNYLSTEVIEAEYSEIDEIDLVCRMTGDEDEQSIFLHYKFKMRNTDEIFVVSATTAREVRARIPRRLNSWVKADALARDAGALAPAKRYTWRDEVDQLEVRPDECRAELSRFLTADETDKVMILFQTAAE